MISLRTPNRRSTAYVLSATSRWLVMCVWRQMPRRFRIAETKGLSEKREKSVMVSKGNHPLLWPWFRLVKYSNLPRCMYDRTNVSICFCTYILRINWRCMDVSNDLCWWRYTDTHTHIQSYRYAYSWFDMSIWPTRGFSRRKSQSSPGEQMKASITALSKRVATVEEKPDPGCGGWPWCGKGRFTWHVGRKTQSSRAELVLWFLHYQNVFWFYEFINIYIYIIYMYTHTHTYIYIYIHIMMYFKTTKLLYQFFVKVAPDVRSIWHLTVAFWGATKDLSESQSRNW